MTEPMGGLEPAHRDGTKFRETPGPQPGCDPQTAAGSRRHGGGARARRTLRRLREGGMDATSSARTERGERTADRLATGGSERPAQWPVREPVTKK